MCLNTIDRNAKPFRRGYKAFVRGRTHLYPELCGRHKPLPTNLWIHEAGWRSRGTDPHIIMNRIRYPFGWHVAKTRKAITDYLLWNYGYDTVEELPSDIKIYRVRCRKMHTIGKQAGGVVGVCEEIFIEGEVRG